MATLTHSTTVGTDAIPTIGPTNPLLLTPSTREHRSLRISLLPFHTSLYVVCMYTKLYFGRLIVLSFNMASTTLLQASIPILARANVGILNHKLLLMKVMRETLGSLDDARKAYQQVCPRVHASMGQHIRHSMDHIELAIQAASSSSASTASSLDIHYDLRARGGPDEHDMDMAEQRIRQAIHTLSNLSNEWWDADDSQSQQSQQRQPVVYACFMLSGQNSQEFRLPTTIPRELGFAVHHAIHHMAMIKIIAIETLQIPPESLPKEFGRAPSTVVFLDNDDQISSS